MERCFVFGSWNKIKIEIITPLTVVVAVHRHHEPGNGTFHFERMAYFRPLLIQSFGSREDMAMYVDYRTRAASLRSGRADGSTLNPLPIVV